MLRELQTPHRELPLKKRHKQRSEKLAKRLHASERRYHELMERLAASRIDNYAHLESITAQSADIAHLRDSAQSMERSLESQQLTLLEFQKPSQMEEILPPSVFRIPDVETDLNAQIKPIASNSALQHLSKMHIVFSLIVCNGRVSI